MHVIRLLKLDHFSDKKGRFISGAFVNTDHNPKRGASVVDHHCALHQPDSLCECAHIARYYRHKFQEPCAFWVFESEALGIEAQVVEELSDQGDPCHRNIRGLSDNKLKKFFRKEWRFEHTWFCIEGQKLPCSIEAALKYKAEYTSSA